MNEEIQKTGKEREKVGKGHPPKEYQFTSERQPENRGRKKGKRNFDTDWELACREVAEALRLGKEPNKVKIELIKTGIKAGLKEKFPFWKEILERTYGKVPDIIDTKVSGLKEIVVRIVEPKEKENENRT